MSNPNHTPQVRNITRLFRQATAEQVQAGRDWYAEAHDYALELSGQYGVSLVVASGVIAATSPLASWVHNKSLAARVIAAGGLTEGYLPVQLAKASAILAGADPMDVLGGDKTLAFYQGILTRGATDVVTIDRHAWSLAVNFRYAEGTIPTLKGKRYAAAVAAYHRATAILSAEYGPLSAAQVQAVTWIVWRRKFWADGAWDGTREQVAA